MAAEQSLVKLICSPMDSLEEIILNENSSIGDLSQLLPVLDDIINNSKSLYSAVVKRIKKIKFSQLDKEELYYPIFYSKRELIGNKYIMSKFYGLPFMRQREPWPRNKKEIPLKFLCQIIHPSDPNILYRIFIDVDAGLNADVTNADVTNADVTNADVTNVDSNAATILPINIATSKWLKSTAMVFKEMPFNSNEYLIKEWVPYKELKDDYNIMTNKLILPPLMNPTEINITIYFGNKILQLEKNNILLI
jgi:hypothetical protein